MKTLNERITETLKAHGADLVGFGGIERFRDTAVPAIFPKARTVIGAAFRVLRGSHRGVEEGSTYYQYTTTGVETIEETVMPLAMLRACAVLEDAGFDALPQKRNQLIMQSCDDTNPEVNYSEIYRGKTAENQLDFEEAAVLCGLGERGFSGTLLTDDFGPFQRLCFILTDAELEETPLPQPHLCDRCGKCAQACPGHAIDPSSGKVDHWQCAAYYVGANMTKNPFMPPDAYLHEPDRLAIIAGEAKLSPERARKIIDETFFYPPIKHAYLSSICGRACDVACYIHLEEKGVLKRSFKTPFRKRPEWKLSIQIETEEEKNAHA